MKKKELRVETEGRVFVIKKFSAARSYSILVEILTKALPLNLIGSALEEFVPAHLLNLSGKKQMSMEEFESLQLKLVECVSEVLDAGPVAVIDKDGNFAVEDLEDNMIIFGQLLIKVVEFQYKDFFQGILAKIGVEMTENMNLLNTISGGR